MFMVVPRLMHEKHGRWISCGVGWDTISSPQAPADCLAITWNTRLVGVRTVGGSDHVFDHTRKMSTVPCRSQSRKFRKAKRKLNEDGC